MKKTAFWLGGNEEDGWSVQVSLAESGFRVLGTLPFPGIWCRLFQEETDVVFLEMDSAESSPIDILQEIHSFVPEIPVICLGSEVSLRALWTCMEQGAYDYLLKPYPLLTGKEIIEETERRGRLSAGKVGAR
ncbi:MAG: hypothetical protein HYU64_21050 [Armatimonadetes bacterium]|nr:hypothetical protein [Armatimonadota bacterium]